MFVSDKDIDTI